MLGKFFIIPTYRISPILSAERWMMSLLTRFETSVLCVHSRDLPHKLCIYVSCKIPEPLQYAKSRELWETGIQQKTAKMLGFYPGKCEGIWPVGSRVQTVS